MDTLTLTKQALRKAYRIRKAAYISKGHHNAQHHRLRDNLLKVLQLSPNPKNIGSYANVVERELIPPFVEGLTYAYPVFSRSSREMQFVEHTINSLYGREAGIKVPVGFDVGKIATNRLEIVLVPLMCFTVDRHRIGYGGGYYDTFIHGKRSQEGCKPIFIGVGAETLKYEGRDSDQVFSKHDQPLDFIITESAIY